MRLGTMHSSMSAPLSEPSAAMYSYLVYWIIKKKRIWEKKTPKARKAGKQPKAHTAIFEDSNQDAL
jgi:hypothetical protein